MLFIRRANKTYTTAMTWMILRGQRSKHQKIPRPQIYLPPPPQKKFPYRTIRPKYASTTTNLQLYQAAQDNNCQIFLTQKIPESKISNTKKSFDHRRHLKSGILPLVFCSTPSFLTESFAYDVLHNHKKDSQIRSWIGETNKWKGNNHEWEKNQVILYFLETEIHSTGKRSTLNSCERACNKLQWVS